MTTEVFLPETESQRWQAVIARDWRCEGEFVFGVASTGIYCRPGCPARTPQLKHIRFFDTGEAAKAAGFRPCLRCRPDEVSSRQRLVERVQALIETTDVEPSLAVLALACGVSAPYLQRTFRASTGVSPHQYASSLRSQRLKTSLRNTPDVTTAMYDAGYASSRAMYDTASRSLGMKPRHYREHGKGEQIRYGIVDSTLGRMIIAATAVGVCFVGWGEDEGLKEELRREFGRAELIDDGEAVRRFADSIRAFLTGESAEVPLDLRGTPFQLAVWDALRTIPTGGTMTYGAIARQIGKPSAARAVGHACGSNPVPPIVPCHRAVGSNGSLTGHRWGLERKRALLAKEQGS